MATSFVRTGNVSPMLGGGEMGRHVRETDWSSTPLGAYETWSQSLPASSRWCRTRRASARSKWGPDQWLLYNEAYGAALGDRHPWALARPMPKMLVDIAPVLGPQLPRVLAMDEGFSIELLSMTMRRHWRNVEAVGTYGYTPVQGEAGGFAGVLLWRRR